MEDRGSAFGQAMLHIALFLVVHGGLIRNLNFNYKPRKQKQSFKRKELP